MYDEYHDEIADERASLPSGAMKATLSKLSGYVMRIALTLHIADFASSCPDGEVPKGIPRIDEETMKSAIILTKWYRREAQRILQMVCPDEVVAGDGEVAAILGHLKKHGKTTARKVAQNLKAFSGAGGTEQASKKLEEMVTSGLLIHDDQMPPKRVYFLHNANIAPDSSGEIDNSVGGCRRLVGGKIDANTYENKELEQSVGVVGDLWGTGTTEDFAGYFATVSGSPEIVDDDDEEDDEWGILGW